MSDKILMTAVIEATEAPHGASFELLELKPMTNLASKRFKRKQAKEKIPDVELPAKASNLDVPIQISKAVAKKLAAKDNEAIRQLWRANNASIVSDVYLRIDSMPPVSDEELMV